MNFVVLVSGNGSNLKAIIDAVKRKKIKSHLGLVISDNKKAYALKRAEKAKIPSAFIDPKAFSKREAFDRAILAELKLFNIDFVVLAGFMRILSPYFIKQYSGRILNIHPALLPSFKGAHAIKDAFEYGAKVTGVTVHFVDEKVDHGPIIMQQSVEIKKKDTLQALEDRIHKIEHKFYPKVIQLFENKKLKIVGRKVK